MFPTPWNVFVHRAGLRRLFPRMRMVDEAAGDESPERECDWVPGCYLLARREVIEQVGLFDPRFFLYYEEVDFCRRVKAAGWQVWRFGGTEVVHLGGESAKSDGPLTSAGQQLPALQIESELLYFRKHHGLAGLLGFVALSLLANAWLASKWLLRRRSAAGLAPLGRQLRSLSSLLIATRAGSTPHH
jgi:hypothetical protein